MRNNVRQSGKGAKHLNKNSYLVQLSEGTQTDFGRIDFDAQSYDQKVFSAVWSIESEVNMGGFASYFCSWLADTASFAPAALEAIGAAAAAAIAREALAAVGDLPADDEGRQSLVDSLDDATREQLEVLDGQFMAYPDDLTGCLFSFVAARPETFGPVPEVD